MLNENSPLKKFVDWVNADTGLPPFEEREKDEHGGHDEHDAHGGHDSHDAHGDAGGDLDGFGDLGGLEDFDMASISEDEEDDELDNTKMLVDTLQSMGGFAAPPPATESKNKRPPSPLLKEGLPRSRSAHVFFRIISMALMAGIIVGLLITVASLPPFGSPDNPAINEVYTRYIEKGVEETGAINVVSGIVLDYRAFDTLGETVVLFATIIAIIVLIRISSDVGTEIETTENDETPQPLILKHIVMILLPFVFMYGIYVLLNGHITPGGGFSGGAILGGGISLYVNAFGPEKVRRIFSFKTFAAFFSFGFIFYTLTKVFTKVAYGLSIEIPLGTPGNLFSGGVVLPLNISIGIVVACAVYGLYALFSEGEV